MEHLETHQPSKVFRGTLAEVKAYFDEIPETSEVELRVFEREEASALGEEQPVIDAKNAAAIAYLERKLKEEATDDPEEIRKSEEEYEDLKRNLNANRAATGERLVFS